LFFGVIKPNLGLSPEPFAELAYEAWQVAGVKCPDSRMPDRYR